MDYDKVCDELLNNIDMDLSSIFDQISEDDVFITSPPVQSDSSSSSPVSDQDPKFDKFFNIDLPQNINKNTNQSITPSTNFKFMSPPTHRPAKSTDFIGRIKRTVPFKRDVLYPLPVNCLEDRLNEMGVTAVMPQVYANRSSRFIAMGLVEPGGEAFTEKGQEIAAQYLQKRKGYTPEQAMQRAKNARSLKRVQPSSDQEVVAAFFHESYDNNVSSVELGYS